MAPGIRRKTAPALEEVRQAAFDAAFVWLRQLEEKHPRAPALYRRARESMGILAAVEATARALGES